MREEIGLLRVRFLLLYSRKRRVCRCFGESTLKNLKEYLSEIGLQFPSFMESYKTIWLLATIDIYGT